MDKPLLIPWESVLKVVSVATLRFKAEAADTTNTEMLRIAEAKLEAVKQIQEKLWGLAGDAMKKDETCETCRFWGQSSGEFGVCLGPKPADRAAKTDTCDDWKKKEANEVRSQS